MGGGRTVLSFRSISRSARWSIGGERKFTGILHDLTARVRMEEQLREQAALARLGEMAAVIAHEVKNPLAGIRGAIQVIGGRLPARQPRCRRCEEIVARIDALNGLVNDLLLFARPPRPSPEAVDWRRWCARRRGWLQRTPQRPACGSTCTVRRRRSRPTPTGRDRVRQPADERRTGDARAGGDRRDLKAVDGYCELAFHDAGPGIPADCGAKIFTPFFTTKSAVPGSGCPPPSGWSRRTKGRSASSARRRRHDRDRSPSDRCRSRYFSMMRSIRVASWASTA